MFMCCFKNATVVSLRRQGPIFLGISGLLPAQEHGAES